MIECKRCGACCSVFCVVELTKEDERRIPDKYTEPYPLIPGVRMMKTTGFVCQQHVHGCAIYSIRPEICRNFQPGSELCLKAQAQYAK